MGDRMSEARPEIPRTDFRVPPKVKKVRRTIRRVVDHEAEYAWIKANLALHGVLNPDGGWKF